MAFAKTAALIVALLSFAGSLISAASEVWIPLWEQLELPADVRPFVQRNTPLVKVIYAGKGLGEVRPRQLFPLNTIQASGRPLVQFQSANPKKQYALIMIDFDVPDAGKPAFCHWLVVNIPGAKLADGGSPPEGDTMLDYREPTPPDSGVKHRYVFLVFEQIVSVPTAASEPPARARFNLAKFVGDNAFQTPAAGGNFFRTQKP